MAWPERPGSPVSPQAHLQLARVDAQRQGVPAAGSMAAAEPKRAAGTHAEPPRSAPRRLPPIPHGSSRPAAVQDARSHMVQRLRDHLGIRDPRVLAAIAGVWRHRFVDSALAAQAYEDTSLPIGHGQTISKPSVVARMIELLAQGEAAQAANGLGRTLEIGTGCGYQAAVLCRLATEVFSIERLQALHEAAKQILSDQRPRNLRLIYGDGMRGHPPNAPYASVISAAGGDHVPQAWLDQLAIGGRLVAPVVSSAQGSQALRVIDRTASGFRECTLEAVHFVPLKSGSS